ncbi:hypothetical protein PHLGIDRAFT_115415 [Phlebiopsis gigantea 11061_1 CR5-6]|uniref:Uncharacterized protein n=1 Tax=Phlebiopsis gigantea (strain 11061_1 CR5-6) TaxID=745531 RepID=A0A0C3SBZ3_PHLG1|nr:hypothetical protein PHLGIDRAFT_115415 [Phlebiopsis gigantea 11061_1 CR5-6]
MEPNVKNIPWQGREPTFQGFKNEDLLLQIAASQAKSHPELVALRTRHDIEVNQVTSPLMLGIACKDKEGVAELAYVRARFTAAREALFAIRSVDIGVAMTALLRLEHEEVARRVEAQAQQRLRRVRDLGRMLEDVRAFKEQEHEEHQAMLQNNAMLELKLRMHLDDKGLEERHQLEIAAARRALAAMDMNNLATSQDIRQAHHPVPTSFTDATKTALRPSAPVFNPQLTR